MQTTLENRKNVAINFPKNAPKTKNEVEEGGALSSGVKMEHENIDVKGQKMMKGIVEPFVVPTLV